MNWWSIRIDPLPLPQRLIPRLPDLKVAVGPSYRLWLPLIPDGRISLPMFQADPARATMTALDPGQNERSGQIELRDHQWICTWLPLAGHEAPELRIIGARFGLGEVIGLRPVRGVIELYRVAERST